MERLEGIGIGAIIVLLVVDALLFGVQLQAAQHSIVMVCGTAPQGRTIYLYEASNQPPVANTNPDSKGSWALYVPYDLSKVWVSLQSDQTGPPSSALAVLTSHTVPAACGIVGPTPEINIGALSG